MELVQEKEQVKAGLLVRRISEAALLLSQVSLGAAIVLIPLRYHWTLQARPISTVYIDYTSIYLYPADIGLLLTLVFWAVSLLCQPRRISLRPALLTVSLAGVLLISAISTLFSIDPVLSLYNTVRMLALFGLYLYLVNEVHHLKMIIAPVGFQLFIQAVVGVAQVLRQHSLGLVSLKEIPLDPAVNGVSIVWAAGLRSLRAYGLTDHPNLLGGCLAFALLLLVAAYLEARPAWRPWLGGLIGLGGLALLVTFSRAAWLGLFAGLALLGIWLAIARLRGHLLLFLGICAGGLLLLAPVLWADVPFLSSRLNLDGSFSSATTENQSIHERSLLAARAGQIIAESPMVGVGLGTFPEALQKQDPAYPFDYQPPHLVVLEVAAETGLAGAALYLLALAAPFLLLLTSLFSLSRGRAGKLRLISSLASVGRRALPSPLLPTLASGSASSILQLAGLTAALAALVVVSFLDYYPWLLNPGRSWQWLLWGLWGGVFVAVSKRVNHA